LPLNVLDEHYRALMRRGHPASPGSVFPNSLKRTFSFLRIFVGRRKP
jgi:hypothetical protein